MLVNVAFMKMVEKEGLKIKAGDIIVTSCENQKSFYYNYVFECDGKAKLLDIEESLFYADYDDIEKLIEQAKKGYIINKELQAETILKVIKNDDVMEILKLHIYPTTERRNLNGY